jgi:hypothetical protein
MRRVLSQVAACGGSTAPVGEVTVDHLLGSEAVGDAGLDDAVRLDDPALLVLRDENASSLRPRSRLESIDQRENLPSREPRIQRGGQR